VAGLGAPELIIILLIVMLIFGSTKLPKLARSLGESSKEFKKGLAEGANATDDEPKPDAKS
jgi:sec-independent protein translocase protein TatA